MQTNIKLEGLKAVTTIISHAGCADGIASAMICAGALGWKPEVRLIYHNSPEHIDLKPERGMLFVDFSPHPDRAQEFLEVGAIVIDHHKGAKDLMLPFIAAGQGAFADEIDDPGICGASLAYSEVWKKMFSGPTPEVERFATLSGIRDTWQKNDLRFCEASAMAMMLKFLGYDHFAEKNLSSPTAANYALSKVLYDKHEKKIAEHCDERVIVQDVAGYKVAFHYDTGGITSDVAETMRGRGVQITIGFFYVIEDGRPKIVFSTRSDDSFDVSKFCKYFGGNGHTKAAGFSQFLGDDPQKRFARPLERDIFEGEQNPWFFARQLFSRYVGQLSGEEFAPGT